MHKAFWLFFVLFSPLYTFAADDHGSHGDGEYDAGAEILHHIKDANEFHIVGDLTLPLPCILYNRETGQWDMFLSSALYDENHHHITKNGYGLHHGQIYRKDKQAFIDFSITKNVVTMLVSASLLCIIFISVARRYKKREGKAPKGLQSLVEPLIVFLRNDVIKANIGPRYERYVPFLLTLFFFIWFNNLLGLFPIFPGTSNVSGNISFTMTLALITMLVIVVSGRKHYWSHIFAMPGVPKPVLIILTPIELAGIFIKPVALMIRLFANITAGHIIVLSLVSLVFIFGKAGASISGGATGAAIAVPFLLFMNALELFVAFLQAFIFTILASLFIGEATAEPHH